MLDDDDIDISQLEKAHRRILGNEEKQLEKKKQTANALQAELRRYLKKALTDEPTHQNIARDLYEARTNRNPAKVDEMKAQFSRNDEIITGYEERRFQDDDFEDERPNLGPRFTFPR